FQAEDGIRDFHVTGVQTCALPIWVLDRFEPWMALAFTEGSIGGDIERVNLGQLAEFYATDPVARLRAAATAAAALEGGAGAPPRSEEHTSELQSRENLVCRLLLEK